LSINKAKQHRLVRTWHRRLGLVIGIQLLFWTVGGIYFAWFHIDNVHGDYERRVTERVLPASLSGMPAADVFLKQSRLKVVKEIRVGRFMDNVVVRLYQDKDRVEMYDAFSGRLLSPISEEQARQAARLDFMPDSPIGSVTLVKEKQGEYKGPVPAYKVSFANAKNTNIYVHAPTGLVTFRRNSIWRGFDFLWMLHIMDYHDREDINNWILRILSVLGLVTVLSGYLLWFYLPGRKTKGGKHD